MGLFPCAGFIFSLPSGRLEVAIVVSLRLLDFSLALLRAFCWSRSFCFLTISGFVVSGSISGGGKWGLSFPAFSSLLFLWCSSLCLVLILIDSTRGALLLEGIFLGWGRECLTPTSRSLPSTSGSLCSGQCRTSLRCGLCLHNCRRASCSRSRP